GTQHAGACQIVNGAAGCDAGSRSSCLWAAWHLRCIIGPEMHSTAFRTRRASALALGGLTLLALALPGSRSSFAAPPTEADFRVLYYITDEDGDRGRQMSKDDMELFVNQARCECNQKLITRITYQGSRSEEHTSELQSRENLVCRLLLEKKNRPLDGVQA